MLSFLPDSSDIAPEILQSVVGVPTLRGYKSPPSGIDAGLSALAAASQGGAFLVKLDGSVRTIVGTSTKLYEAGSSSWTDVSRAGNYTAGAARWRFAQFGNTSLAINKSTVLQSSTSGAFADVSNAPKAACMEAAAGFVILANVDDTGSGLSTSYGDQGNRWWCSQIFNPTGTWAPDVSTQATSGLLVETAGAITGLKRLNSGIIAYKDKSIYVGQYVGPPVVWQWQCVSTDVGCPSGDAVVAAQNAHYFIGSDDIYAFDGTRPTPIGSGVREWFFGRLNRLYSSYIQAIHDRVNQTIFWFYPSGSDQTLNSCLVYHYGTQRWGAFDLTILDTLEAVTSTVTYDSLGSLYSTYDDLPNISYDSPFWNANTPVLSYIDSSYKLTSLSGGGADSSLRTGWYGDEITVTAVTRVRPRFRTSPATSTLTGSTVMNLGDTPVVGTSTDLYSGWYNTVQAGNFHRFDLTFTGSMEIESIRPILAEQGQ